MIWRSDMFGARSLVDLDVDRRGRVRYRRTSNRATRAVSRPLTAEEIAIRRNVYGTKAPALDGGDGHGRLPSLEYMSQGGGPSLRDPSPRIEVSTVAVGLWPATIRHRMHFRYPGFSSSRRGLVVGPPDSWSGDTTAMTVGREISAFIVAGDLARAGTSAGEAAQQASNTINSGPRIDIAAVQK
jgi:hypothetical protein